MSASAVWIDELVAALPHLLTAAEAGRALRASRRSIGRWVSTGRLQVVRVSNDGSGRVLIPRASVADFLRNASEAA